MPLSKEKKYCGHHRKVIAICILILCGIVSCGASWAIWTYVNFGQEEHRKNNNIQLDIQQQYSISVGETIEISVTHHNVVLDDDSFIFVPPNKYVKCWFDSEQSKIFVGSMRPSVPTFGNSGRLYIMDNQDTSDFWSTTLFVAAENNYCEINPLDVNFVMPNLNSQISATTDIGVWQDSLATQYLSFNGSPVMNSIDGVYWKPYINNSYDWYRQFHSNWTSYTQAYPFLNASNPLGIGFHSSFRNNIDAFGDYKYKPFASEQITSNIGLPVYQANLDAPMPNVRYVPQYNKLHYNVRPNNNIFISLDSVNQSIHFNTRDVPSRFDPTSIMCSSNEAQTITDEYENALRLQADVSPVTYSIDAFHEPVSIDSTIGTTTDVYGTISGLGLLWLEPDYYDFGTNTFPLTKQQYATLVQSITTNNNILTLRAIITNIYVNDGEYLYSYTGATNGILDLGTYGGIYDSRFYRTLSANMLLYNLSNCNDLDIVSSNIYGSDSRVYSRFWMKYSEDSTSARTPIGETIDMRLLYNYDMDPDTYLCQMRLNRRFDFYCYDGTRYPYRVHVASFPAGTIFSIPISL